MPLPTTNLTAHFDASTNAKVYSTGLSPATDGQLVERWADAEGKDLSFWYVSSSASSPTYRVGSPLMPASCTDFDGSTDFMKLWNNAGSVSKALSDVLGASAKTVLLSFYVEAVVGASDVPSDNEALIGDASAFFGIAIQDEGAGVYKLQGYNWDGNADKIELPISLNTSYVVMLRHDGTNLYMSLNGGSESNVASGATSTTTGQMQLGRIGASDLYNGRIGEVALYNVNLAAQSTDLATAIAYFTAKWLPTANVTVALGGTATNANAGTASGPYDPTVQLPAIFYDTTYVAPTGSTIVVGAGGDFQAALTAASPGDTITLNAGSTYTALFTLPSKGGSAYIHIRSSASLTPEGVRITPAQGAGFPKIVSPDGDPAPAIQAAPGSSYYRFINCEFTSGSTPVNLGVIALGAGDENSLALFPHHLIVDRCYVHGSLANGGRRGVMFCGSYQAVIDSYISDCKEVGNDAQAIAGWTGAGPYKIVNNYLEGAGENVMFGGADTKIANLTPSDIEMRNNHLFKPLSWNPADPSFPIGGSLWTIKNTFELKHAKRVLFDGNLIENCWGGAQTGYCVLFTGRNQSGSNTWAAVTDVTFTNNEIRNSLNGINLSGQDTESGTPSDISRRALISRNLMTGIGTGSTTQGNPFLVGSYTSSGYEDVTIDHNTMLHTGTLISVAIGICPRFKFTNNICQHNQYGIKGDGTNSGNPTIAVFFPGSTITNNLIQSPDGWGPQTLPPQVGDPFDGQWYPAGNYFPHQLTDIQFVNYPTDLHLSLSSPYQNKGTAGTDPGYIETAAATFNPAWAASCNQLVM